MMNSALDMFKNGELSRGVIFQSGDAVIRPEEAELATFVELDQDDYREEYRKRCGRWPNARAWVFWHKHHDKIVLRRGLR